MNAARPRGGLLSPIRFAWVSLGLAGFFGLAAHVFPILDQKLTAKSLRVQQRLFVEILEYERLVGALDEATRGVMLAPGRPDLRERKQEVIKALQGQLSRMVDAAPSGGQIPAGIIDLASHFRKTLVVEADQVERFAQSPGDWALRRFRADYAEVRAEHLARVKHIADQSRALVEQRFESGSRRVMWSGVACLGILGVLSFGFQRLSQRVPDDSSHPAPEAPPVRAHHPSHASPPAEHHGHVTAVDESPHEAGAVDDPAHHAPAETPVAVAVHEVHAASEDSHPVPVAVPVPTPVASAAPPSPPAPTVPAPAPATLAAVISQPQVSVPPPPSIPQPEPPEPSPVPEVPAPVVSPASAASAPEAVAAESATVDQDSVASLLASLGGGESAPELEAIAPADPAPADAPSVQVAPAGPAPAAVVQEVTPKPAAKAATPPSVGAVPLADTSLEQMMKKAPAMTAQDLMGMLSGGRGAPATPPAPASVPKAPPPAVSAEPVPVPEASPAPAATPTASAAPVPKEPPRTITSADVLPKDGETGAVDLSF